jgi:E3 ubiquitin-protein ligase UBR7
MAEENGVARVDQDGDSRSDVSSSGLPPPLITAEDYDTLVCRKCVSQIPILQAWAGTPGVAMVVREGPDVSWKVIGALQESDLVVDVGSEAEGKIPARVEAPDPDHAHTHTATQSLSGDASPPQPDPDTLQGMKRSLLKSCSSPDGPSVKRLRTSGTTLDPSQRTCLAPAAHPIAQAVFAQSGTQTLGAGDIFLSGGDWRKRWCLCDSCLSEPRKHPYLFEEEVTYEPPEDPDSREFQSSMTAGRMNNGTSELSLEELGLRALERLPRDRALDGIRAFNTMRYAGIDVP